LKELDKRISPDLACSLDVYESGGKKIIVIQVPRGDDPPYAVDDNKIYVRSEAETDLPYGMKLSAWCCAGKPTGAGERRRAPCPPRPSPQPVRLSKQRLKPLAVNNRTAPRTGVEVRPSNAMKNLLYHADLATTAWSK
jgi:hypothetical protein